MAVSRNARKDFIGGEACLFVKLYVGIGYALGRISEVLYS